MDFRRIAAALTAAATLAACGSSDSPTGSDPDGDSTQVAMPGLQAPWADEAHGLGNPSAVAIAPDGRVFVCHLKGRGALHFAGEVVVLQDTDGDGRADSSTVFVDGIETPVGLAFAEGDVFVSTYGAVMRYSDTDGDGRADVSTEILSLTAYGMHVNNGIAIGPDNRLYVALGSELNFETGGAQLRSKFLSVNLDGSDLRVFADGVRNAYDLAFNSAGDLFATENGPDGDEVNAQEAAHTDEGWLYPEELNHVIEGGHYGFPDVYGTPPAGSGTIGPIAEWETHSGAQGLAFNEGSRFPAYAGHLFVAMYHAGRIDAVELIPEATTYRTVVREALVFPCVDGTVFPQPTGHRDCAHMHPLDVAFDDDGNLFIAAFGSINGDLSTRLPGAIYKVVALQ